MPYNHVANISTLRLLRACSAQRLDDVAMATKIAATRLSRLETGEAAATRAEIRTLAAFYGVPWPVIMGAEPPYVTARPPVLGS